MATASSLEETLHMTGSCYSLGEDQTSRSVLLSFLALTKVCASSVWGCFKASYCNCSGALFYHYSEKSSIPSQFQRKIHFITYSTMVHMVLHVSAVQRWLINLWRLWLVKTMIDFSGCDRWEPSLLMVQNGTPSVLISTHWGEKKSVLVGLQAASATLR